MLAIKIILICLAYQSDAGRHPVLLVPGLGASQMKTKYIGEPVGLRCHEMNKSFFLWVDPKYFLPYTIDCTINLMRLEYNSSTQSTHSPKYCEVQAPGFGTVDTISYLSQYQNEFSAYYIGIISNLVNKQNYQKNVDIRGAPYDFRKGSKYTDKYLANVKRLIEEMYNDNNKKSVVIIAHSLGNLYVLRLLNRMSQRWKDKYVRSFISISAPYAGSLIALQAVLSGFKSAAFYLHPVNIRKMESTWPSMYYLMPLPEMWPSNDDVVITKDDHFKAKDISKVLQLSNVTLALELYKYVRKNRDMRQAPRVETHCVFSVELETPYTLDYRTVNFPNDRPVMTTVNGDGTVPINSLLVCPMWKTQQKQLVTLHTIHRVSHLNILKNANFLTLINDIIEKINN